MKSFRNKTVLVTGASSGIGECFARLLAAKQANLILTARSKDKLNDLANELNKRFKIQAHVFPGDLSSPNTPQTLFEQVSSHGLEVDVVINNAGFGKWGHFESINYATYEEMCNLNMQAVVALTYLFLPNMLVKKTGGFINVASTAAFQPVPYFATYSATKAFVLSFSEALWGEYRERGLTVTCLCPGGTESNFHEVSEMDPDKIIGLESAEKVAELGLSAFLKGKLTVISGVKNYLLANSIRLANRKTVTKISAAMFRPKKSIKI
ncbi:MAG: SDR family NAD(P)-dependent oxidoreductase [bacterium]